MCTMGAAKGCKEPNYMFGFKGCADCLVESQSELDRAYHEAQIFTAGMSIVAIDNEDAEEYLDGVNDVDYFNRERRL